jgi:hypothetical protein
MGEVYTYLEFPSTSGERLSVMRWRGSERPGFLARATPAGLTHVPVDAVRRSGAVTTFHADGAPGSVPAGHLAMRDDGDGFGYCVAVSMPTAARAAL